MLAELIIDSELCGVRGAEQSARMRRSEVNSAQEIGIWKQHISALPPVNTLTDATRRQRDQNRPQIPRKRCRVLKLWPWGWNLEILQTFLIQLLNEPISVWAGCVLVWMLQGLVTTFYMLYRCGIQNLGSEVLFFFFLLAPLKSTRGRHRPRLISMKLNQTELLLQPAATIQRSTLIAPPNFTLNWKNVGFFCLCVVSLTENLSERAFLFLFFFFYRRLLRSVLASSHWSPGWDNMMSVSDHAGVFCKSNQHSFPRVGLAVWRRARSRAAVQTPTIWSDEQPEANSGVPHKQTALGAACVCWMQTVLF